MAVTPSPCKHSSGLIDTLEIVDDRHVRITIVEDFSPVLVLNALSAGIASVVDKELVLANEVDGDLGNQWLKTNSAGSGAFSLKSSNETVVLDPDYRHGHPDHPAPRHRPRKDCCSRRATSIWRAI